MIIILLSVQGITTIAWGITTIAWGITTFSLGITTFSLGITTIALGITTIALGITTFFWAIAQCFKKTVFVLKNKEHIAGECFYKTKNIKWSVGTPEICFEYKTYQI